MTTRVILAGGLGNQLFQLAAGLVVSDGQEVLLNYTLANPRLTNTGLPDISNFILPKGVTLESTSNEGALAKKNRWILHPRKRDKSKPKLGFTFVVLLKSCNFDPVRKISESKNKWRNRIRFKSKEISEELIINWLLSNLRMGQ